MGIRVGDGTMCQKLGAEGSGEAKIGRRLGYLCGMRQRSCLAAPSSVPPRRGGGLSWFRAGSMHSSLPPWTGGDDHSRPAAIKKNHVVGYWLPASPQAVAYVLGTRSRSALGTAERRNIASQTAPSSIISARGQSRPKKIKKKNRRGPTARTFSVNGRWGHYVPGI